MHFKRSDWFAQCRLLAHVPQFDLIWRVIALSFPVPPFSYV